MLGPDLERAADSIEWVAGPTAMTQNVLLHPSTHLVHHLPAELDHMEGVQHGDRLGSSSRIALV